jgi:hypothetical protein
LLGDGRPSFRGCASACPRQQRYVAQLSQQVRRDLGRWIVRRLGAIGQGPLPTGAAPAAEVSAPVVIGQAGEVTVRTSRPPVGSGRLGLVVVPELISEPYLSSFDELGTRLADPVLFGSVALGASNDLLGIRPSLQSDPPPLKWSALWYGF